MSTEIVRTAFDRVQRELGCEFMDWEGWRWPNHFGDPIAEHRAVREDVGVWDESPLRKWELRGADALRAADRVFTNDMLGLEVGQVRLRAVLRRGRKDGRRRDRLQVRRRPCVGDHGARLRPRPHPRGRQGDRRGDRAGHRAAAAPSAAGAALARAARRPHRRRRRGPSLLPVLAGPGRGGRRPLLGLSHRVLGRGRLRALLRARARRGACGPPSPEPVRAPTASPPSRRSGSSPG